MGPEGPTGPAGPEGEPGPGTRLTFRVTINSEGDAVAVLPSEVGTVANPPSLTCFVQQPGTPVLLHISQESMADRSCGLVENGG